MTEISQNPSEKPSDKECETSPTTALTSRKKLVPWKPGQSGNPAGRPLGSKNRITQQKIGIEAQLRDQLGEYMPEVLQRAIELALKGDRVMLRLLIEMCMSKAVAVDDVSEGKDKVQVTIRRLNIDQLSMNKQPDVIDVTPESVKNDES
jgi:hypothetical protein